MVLVISRDLDGRVADNDLHDDGMVPETLDLAALRRTFVIEAVGGYEFVSEVERALGPHEDVANPTAIATPPLLAQTVDFAAANPDDTTERSELPLDPALPREHGHQDGNDDDEIDTEEYEQGYEHVLSPSSSMPSVRCINVRPVGGHVDDGPRAGSSGGKDLFGTRP